MSTAITERPTMASKLEASLDKGTANGISLSAGGGLMIESMGQAMEFAKLMCLGRESIPKHLRENAGACLVICVQAFEWRINPIALANKSYVVNDRLCYESAIYHSIVARRAPIVGRIKMEYSGEGDKRVCRVWAELSDGTGIVEYFSPKFHAINPKNSPLWKNDPDQQLFYFSVRSFARRHFPDVMMGIYTVDEMQDSAEFAKPVESRSTADRLASQLITPTRTVDAGGADAASTQSEPDAAKPKTEPAAAKRDPITVESFMRRIEAADLSLIDGCISDLEHMQVNGPLTFEECMQLGETAEARKKELQG